MPTIPRLLRQYPVPTCRLKKKADPKNVEISHAKNQTDSGPTTTASSNITPKTDNDNQGAASSSAIRAEAVDEAAALQQQNEPVKNIIYDFGIACFVVLILALCLRRLLAIFHTL